MELGYEVWWGAISLNKEAGNKEQRELMTDAVSN